MEMWKVLMFFRVIAIRYFVGLCSPTPRIGDLQSPNPSNKDVVVLLEVMRATAVGQGD